MPCKHNRIICLSPFSLPRFSQTAGGCAARREAKAHLSRPHAASEAKLRTMTPQTLQQSIWSCAIGESPAAAGLGKQSRGKRKDSWIELPVKTVLIYNKRCSSKSIAGTLLRLGPREERVCKHQSFGQMAPGLLSHLHSTAAKAVRQLLEAQQVPRSEPAPAPLPEGTAQLSVTPSVDGSWPTAVRGGSYFLTWNEDSVSVGCKIQMFSPLCIADVGDVFPTADSAHPCQQSCTALSPQG